MKLTALWEDADYEHIIDMLLEYHLSEDRNPELEKSLEPYLTGNFGSFRSKMPQNFKPSVPGLAGKLPQAVNYHAKNMGGQRWPALEQAFLNRSETYKGFKSDYTRPRTSLFTYLKNLNQPWPEGIELARQLANSAIFNTDGGRYVNVSNPDIIECLIKYEIYSPPLIRSISNIVNRHSPELGKAQADWDVIRNEYEKQHNIWLTKREMWMNDKVAELKQKAEAIKTDQIGFHDEDEFGGDDYHNQAYDLFHSSRDPVVSKLRASKPAIPPEPDVLPDYQTVWGEKVMKLAKQYLAMFTNVQGPQ